MARQIGDLPNALGEGEALAQRFVGKRSAVFLDYDGTLTPIRDRPEDAVISDSMREAVRRLAERVPVIVVSGRDRQVLQGLMGLDNLIVAGDHGFDIWSPSGGSIQREEGASFEGLLREVEAKLRADLADIPGALVEPKMSSVAVHFRLVPQEQRLRVKKIVDTILSEHPEELKITPGKMVFEIQPKLDWDKGKAVLYLLKALDLDRDDVVPVYVGDDITDEDAFQALARRGIGIFVGSVGDPETAGRTTAADYVLNTIGEVEQFLNRLVALDSAEGKSSPSGDGSKPNSKEWTLAYDAFESEQERLREVLTSTGNGYFCTRGSAEWADVDDIHYPGTYAHGCYNRETTIMGGHPVLNEDLVNLPNWLVLKLRIGSDEPISLKNIELLSYRHEVDFRTATAMRRLRFRDRRGRETTLESRRFVSMADMHQAALEWTITAENWSGPVEVITALDARVMNQGVTRYRELEGRHVHPVASRARYPDTISLIAQTRQSHIYVAEAARTRVYEDAGELEAERGLYQMEDYAQQTLGFDLQQRRPIRVEKLVSFYTSHNQAINEPLANAEKAVGRFGTFEEAFDRHRRAMKRFSLSVCSPVCGQNMHGIAPVWRTMSSTRASCAPVGDQDVVQGKAFLCVCNAPRLHWKEIGQQMALRTQKQVLKEQSVHLPLATRAHGGHCFPTAWEMSAPCVLSYNYRGDTTDAPSSDPSFGVLIWRKQKAVFFASGQVIGTIAPAHLWGLDWKRLEPHGLTIGYLARMVPPGRAARGPSKEVQRGGLPTSRNQEHEPMLIITRFVRATRAEGGKHVNR